MVAEYVSAFFHQVLKFFLVVILDEQSDLDDIFDLPASGFDTAMRLSKERSTWVSKSLGPASEIPICPAM